MTSGAVLLEMSSDSGKLDVGHSVIPAGMTKGGRQARVMRKIRRIRIRIGLRKIELQP